MTPDDIRIVQESWRKVESVEDIAADLFFTRLFELDPPLRLICEEDLQQRRHRFRLVVGATVRGLARVDMLLPAVREFGARHPLPGEVEHHHGNVARALLWMLEKALRRDFTADVKAAWIKAYGMLSLTIREATTVSRAA